MQKRDLYAEVTQKIVAQLERGVAPWVCPWKSIEPTSLPYNYISKKAYRGINVALLWSAGYERNAWMTYKQAQSVGAHVRKGEKGTMIVFFKPFKITEKNAKGENVTRSIPLLRAFTVFNVAQIEGLPEEVPPAAPALNIPAADAALAQATVTHGGDRACYSPALDAIRMPNQDSFGSVEEYYATALHELTHWTGHKSRCAREFGARFGDSAYAREELVAEMGAAFLCAQFGIEGRLQHAEYIGSWIKCLKEDKRAVVVAASLAQRAADFVLSGTAAAEDDDEETESVELAAAA